MTQSPRRRMAATALALPVAALAVGLGATPAHAATVDSTAKVSQGGGFRPAVSGDGQFVAFATHARLVPADVDTSLDVYVRHTVANSFELVSKNGLGDHPAITPDGRYVAFDSSSQLAAQDVDGAVDIYRYDRISGTTTLVSRGRKAGVETFSHNKGAFEPSISADGNRVAFEAVADDLVDGDTNAKRDVFVRDIAGGFTFRASVSNSEAQAVGGDSTEAAISGDGGDVAFTSTATNLAAADADGDEDVFVRVVGAGITQRASAPAGGGSGDGGGTSPSISESGRFIAFESIEDLATGGTELVCIGAFEGRTPDAYVFDAVGGTLTVASAPSAAAGHDINDIVFAPSISADGQRVAFASAPFDIVSCPNPHPDPNDPSFEEPVFVVGDARIFLRDAAGASTVRVDRSDAGPVANGPSDVPALGAGGAAVAYESLATNLVAGDGDTLIDVFLSRLS